MAEKEYFINDRVVIPNEIKNMTESELEKAIKRLEDEVKLKKQLPFNT